jgi:hypothetical protein
MVPLLHLTGCAYTRTPAVNGHFPASGFSREQCIQLLMNMKFIAAMATSPEGPVALDPFYHPGLDTIFTSGLDILLRALEDSSLKSSWSSPDQHLSMLFYDVLERFHVELVQWIQNYAMSLSFFAEAQVPNASGFTDTRLLLNPATSIHSDAPLLYLCL